MGAAFGVFVGYVLGTRAGEKGYTEMLDACDTIRSSDDVKGFLASGMVIAKELAGRAVTVISGGLQPGADGLRRVA
jgi:hypothetical protein